ncbi:hypothetical protein VTP01DRAFT_9682 [Rhizomucor pusillus]|uniref:uncharacterized protein n=1 Tax=Rhizomucor pusillus TaxID=4840 RepID=UPI003742A9F3
MQSLHTRRLVAETQTISYMPQALDNNGTFVVIGCLPKKISQAAKKSESPGTNALFFLLVRNISLGTFVCLAFLILLYSTSRVL